MNMFRRVIVVLLALGSLLALPVRATSFSTDQSDLWYVPTESGWGLQLVQRGSDIFATMFVYNPGGSPIWYTALLNSVGNNAWSGALYVTNGPWFGTVPFNPNAVARLQVGTMSWVAQTDETGTLTYGIDGVNVVKNVTRETLVLDDFSGRYGMGLHFVNTSCVDPTLNGTRDALGILDITQNGSAIALQLANPATSASCAYAGPLSQFGQLGNVQGSYACTDGTEGTFEFFEMQVTISGITGRFAFDEFSTTGCQSTGWFGGSRATTF